MGSKFLRIYILPGAVFQSVMIGGGYGTGREIIEYFTQYGLLGGFLGIGVAFVVLSIVLATTFEYARRFKLYDYRSFFKSLLGRFWGAYETLIVLQFILVLAVMASASGNVFRDNFGVPYFGGLALMMAVIGVLVYVGRDAVAWALTVWSFILYIVFAFFFGLVLFHSWEPIALAFENPTVEMGWWRSGLNYALYNLAVIPLLLYAARPIETKAQSISAGIIGGILAMAPALLFQIVFFSAYPEIISQPIPVYWLMGRLGFELLIGIYSIMLLGTFVETGAGMLQGINERVDAYMLETHGKSLSRILKSAIAVGAIAVSAGLSFLGITTLIAQGYGTMAWGFLVVYVAPLLTFGLFRMNRQAVRLRP